IRRPNAVKSMPFRASVRCCDMRTAKEDGNRQKTAAEPNNTSDEHIREGQAQVQFDAEALVGFYQKMVEIRLFEEAASRGFRQGKIGGYLHVYSGQEAAAVGFL